MSMNFEKSAKLNDITLDDMWKWFDEHPYSEKKMVACCEICGRERVIKFISYHDLCRSCSQKKYHKENPNVAKERNNIPGRKIKNSAGLIQYYKENLGIQKVNHGTQKARNNSSIGAKKYHKLHPEAGEKHSQDMKDLYVKMDNPGQEIVMHHYIYDFNDLNKYIIPVTRSEHLTIHNRLRWSGLEVPCINILKDE